jgi:pimeloyl-ACP methyl ester carboxylesterase
MVRSVTTPPLVTRHAVTRRSTNGTEVVGIAAYDFGGAGPPLVLAHATGFHAHVFEPLIEHLRALFHCYGFDERGHGASGVPADGDFDWRQSAADLLAVSDHFGLDRPLGFGHSCGGALLLLAEQDRPGSWRAMYTYEPVVPSSEGDGADNPLAAGALRRRADFASRAEALAGFSARPPFSALEPTALSAYVEHGFVDQPDGTVTLACRPQSEAATYRAAPLHHAWDRLGEVTCPVTVAGGADSTHFSPEANGAVAARLPRGSAEILPRLGHFGPLEDPARVATAVAAALAT